MMVDWNSTQTPFPSNVGIHGLFEQQARESAGRIAVIAGDECLTYAELNEQSNQLAHYLRSVGVRRETCVCICMDRSVRMVVAVLGVLKAGGAYLPLDPAYPPDRLKMMCSDGGATAIITLSSLTKDLPTDAVLICLDRDARSIATCGKTNPMLEVNDADLAYVMYTSGSTGKPKGVEVHHGGIVNCATSLARIYDVGTLDTFLSLSTLSFDVCAGDLFIPLSTGGKVVLADRESATDGRRLRHLLETSEATIVQAPPFAWRLLIDAGWRAPDNGVQVSTASTALAAGDAATRSSRGEANAVFRPIKAASGGEALSRDLANMLLDRGVDVWNLYGPTETTFTSTFHRVKSGDETIPIGKPIDNTLLYILDPDAKPVAIGEVGELYIGGAGVARGYRHRPELTTERFLPDPFSHVKGSRIYRTGDLARYRPDGDIEFLGRADHQVKVRGVRIEVQEIEAHLLHQPGVNSALVAPQKGPNGEQRLVAFVVPDDSQALSAATLRSSLQTSLPSSMVPARFIILSTIPINLNGKVDRAALPFPAWSEITTSPYVAPANEMQLGIAEIFAAALKTPRIGANDSFFELGGDSLSAVSVAIEVRLRFQQTVTLATLFHAPTPAELAAVLQTKDANSAASLMTFRRTGAKPPLFCVPGVGGSSFRFNALVARLPVDRPVYGYNIPPIDQRKAPLNAIHDYAADVLREIRTVLPVGPFHLLGFSLGGSVAYELAHMLEIEGQGTCLGYVGMIDAWAPGFPAKPSRVRWLMLHTKKFLSVEPRVQMTYLATRVRNFFQQVSRNLRRKRFLSQSQSPSAPATHSDSQNLAETAEFAGVSYMPPIMNRRFDLYRVAEHPTDWLGCDFDDVSNCWRNFVTGELTITHLPGGHNEVFEGEALSLLTSAVISHLQAGDEAIETR